MERHAEGAADGSARRKVNATADGRSSVGADYESCKVQPGTPNVVLGTLS